MPAQPAVTVAGSGNWLLGHDRIGPRVLRRVDGRYGPDVELCEIGTSALALLDHLHGQRLLLVVDACVGFGRPGEVLVREPDLDAVEGPGSSIHQIGPIEALAVCRIVEPQRMPDRILLVLVETGGLDDSSEDAACDEVLEILDREITALTASGDTLPRRAHPEQRSTPW